jgi:hypothetical protein
MLGIHGNVSSNRLLLRTRNKEIGIERTGIESGGVDTRKMSIGARGLGVFQMKKSFTRYLGLGIGLLRKTASFGRSPLGK